MMQKLSIPGAVCAAVLVLARAASAEADGPDAWRVSGVAHDDVLNIRMGPGTEYPIIGAFGPEARHLRAETCTPLATFGQFNALSEAERAALPARWCLMDGGARGRGWVAQAYLAEDYLPPGATAQSEAGDHRAPPPFDIAVPLVRNLFEKEAFLLGRGDSILLDSGEARSWFFLDVARRMSRNPGAYSLFAGQDADVTDVTAMLDPDNPIRQGVVTVLVRFTNFGSPREARVLVRGDPEQGGAFRVFGIEHQDGTMIP